MIKATKTKKTYYPKRNDVSKLVRTDPSNIYLDADGRIYGFMSANPVLDDLLDSGEVDNQTKFEMWVYLPTHRKGEFAKLNDELYGKQLTTDEILDMPEEGQSYILMNYTDHQPVYEIVAIAYPEGLRRNGRSAALIVGI